MTQALQQPSLPEHVTIHPGALLQDTPRLPGAKYPAVRALLLAALGDGPSRVMGLPRSDDTDVTVAALHQLGVGTQWVDEESLAITGIAGRWASAPAPLTLDVGNAGAVLRLLLGVCAILPEVTFTTTHWASLGQRPNHDLLTALEQLGVQVEAKQPGGLLPITIRGGGLHGGPVRISGARSSQYLSALLLLAPLIGEAVEIDVVDELRSASFVRLTLAMMEQVGVSVDHEANLRHFRVSSPQTYCARDWRLPRDFPTAAIWLTGGAVAGGTLHLAGLPDDTEDGAAILAAMRAFGADMTVAAGDEAGQITIDIQGGARLVGADLDGEPFIDSVPALTALACFAEGTTTFRNVGNLRLKESNRIDDLCTELRRAGADATPGADTITIIGRPGGIAGGVTVDAHHDHRLAMALAIVALRAQAPITITGAAHVAKSYPAFWSELARLGATVEGLG